VQPVESLRRIFDNESHTTQSVRNAAAPTEAFREIESSMYKRRRRLLLLLPTDASDVAARLTGRVRVGRERTGTPFPFFFYTTGTSFWHQLGKKRLKMRINDSRNKKTYFN